jgi:hypothetical protein
VEAAVDMVSAGVVDTRSVGAEEVAVLAVVEPEASAGADEALAAVGSAGAGSRVAAAVL